MNRSPLSAERTTSARTALVLHLRQRIGVAMIYKPRPMFAHGAYVAALRRDQLTAGHGVTLRDTYKMPTIDVPQAELFRALG